MTITDGILIVSSLIFFFQGWNNGFLHSLKSPLAFILAGFLSYLYYKATGNLVVALIGSIVGPFIILLLISLIGKFNKKKKDNPLEEPSTRSRVWGGLLNLVWSGSWVILTFICIALLPEETPFIKPLRNDVLHSQTYAVIYENWSEFFPKATSEVEKLTEALKDPENFKQLQETEEYKRVMEDPKLNALLTDAELVAQVQKKEIGKLLNNPKFRAILEDKESLKKLFGLHKILLENNAASTPQASPPLSEGNSTDN